MPARVSNVPSWLRAALFAGSVAGVLDIVAASLINLAPPQLILQSISSGLLGLASYAGGASTVLLGLILQIAMSIVIASIFAASTRRLPWLLSHPIAAGLAYGVGIFVVMNMLVVPMSAFAPRPKHISLIWLILNLIAMLGFGVIVSVLVQRRIRTPLKDREAWNAAPSDR